MMVDSDVRFEGVLEAVVAAGHVATVIDVEEAGGERGVIVMDSPGRHVIVTDTPDGWLVSYHGPENEFEDGTHPEDFADTDQAVVADAAAVPAAVRELLAVDRSVRR